MTSQKKNSKKPFLPHDPEKHASTPDQNPPKEPHPKDPADPDPKTKRSKTVDPDLQSEEGLEVLEEIGTGTLPGKDTIGETELMRFPQVEVGVDERI